MKPVGATTIQRETYELLKSLRPIHGDALDMMYDLLHIIRPAASTCLWAHSITFLAPDGMPPSNAKSRRCWECLGVDRACLSFTAKEGK